MEVQTFLTNQNIELNSKVCVDIMEKFNEVTNPFNCLKTEN